MRLSIDCFFLSAFPPRIAWFDDDAAVVVCVTGERGACFVDTLNAYVVRVS
jgi:hypothetical protein